MTRDLPPATNHLAQAAREAWRLADDLLLGLEVCGVRIHDWNSLDADTKRLARKYFRRSVFPVVTPYKTTYNGVYYAVDLNATGTTNPTMLNSGSFAAGINRAQLPNGTWRYFNAAGSPFTSLPATLTPNTSGLSRVFTIR